MTLLRVGCVPFINALPLIEGLDRNCELIFDSPAALERRLASGELDAALVPVAALFDRLEWSPVGEWGIASDHASGSVLFFRRPGILRPRRVALDDRSRTSALLMKLLLGPDIDYVPMVAGLDDMLSGAEGALMIGDDALRLQDDPRVAFDLAARWNESQSLPFVFAVWSASALHPARAKMEELFDRAARSGLERIELLAAGAAARLGMPRDRVRRYLLEQLSYRLTPAHRSAIARFDELTVAFRHPSGVTGAVETVETVGTVEAR